MQLHSGPEIIGIGLDVTDLYLYKVLRQNSAKRVSKSVKFVFFSDLFKEIFVLKIIDTEFCMKQKSLTYSCMV